MTRHFRDAFPRRAPKHPAPPTASPWALTESNAKAVIRLVAATGQHPNEILNQLVACALMNSQALHLQLAFGGVLMTPPKPSPAPEAGPAPADPEANDERTAEEKLAELRDVAEANPGPHTAE